ncbi:M48 family metalloprotease [Aridibaculum aurantiacum]|uniref:M48 family metalloprotease n=1 Tax=Aridibaculum aurantiacum TaxID=2810307 RepID=UPI001A9709AB|nr:M48 family metalloprotease [Aridibaculum aurantiacum]
MKKYIGISCYSLLFLFTLHACSRNPVTGKRQLVFMSEEQEIAMGKEADPQIVAHFGLYNDTALQRFITEKGRQMAAISHRPNLQYEFKIVDSDVLNAFAVPGGYVYFTRGIMAHFNNEAEFAGVLGHEIGHITARHTVAQQRNQILGQIGIIAGAVISPEFGRFAETASQGMGLLLLKFGRDAERESDRLGVEYSSKIGYDATEMAGFFNTLERKSQEAGAGEIPTFLSTHPNPGDRNATVAQLAQQWKRDLNLTNPQVNRNAYLRRIEGMIYGADPKQGFVEGNVFYHPELKFQFPIPAGWRHQNSPQSFQMAPQDGKAMMMLTLAQGATLQDAANNVLKQYGLTAIESREVTVNGLRAIAMVADQVPQQGQQQQQQQQVVRTLNYIIQYGNIMYHIVGVSAANDFAAYQPTFSNTMQNFRQLTDAAKLNRQPERIRLRTVAQASTLDQVLRGNRVPANRLEELAVLNGMKLTDRVEQGTLIKVIE